MSKDIFVYIELKDGAVRKASLELLSRGKEISAALSARLCAVVLGHGLKDVGELLRAYSDLVIIVDHELLKEYSWDTCSSAFAGLIERYKPFLVFGPSTVTGKDLFPRLAARFNNPIVSDATGIDIHDGSVKVHKPLYGGKILSWVECKGNSMFFITFRPNSFAVEKKDLDGDVIVENIEPVPDNRVSLVGIEKATNNKMDLQEADFIICGGRGMGGPENYSILEEIATLMGGRVGASRSAVDSKWREYDDQIGKSGKTVSPKLYIGCGVSGALHHIMGMDTSKVIVAINKDPKAPIFQYADYGIVDDMFHILPVLKKELAGARE